MLTKINEAKTLLSHDFCLTSLREAAPTTTLNDLLLSASSQQQIFMPTY
ncbi:MAG: hypothetical protein V7K77_03340 [Nostoc sp.]